MQSNFEVLRQCTLFRQIAQADLEPMLRCFGAKVRSYARGRTILAEGEPAHAFGILLTGKAQIVRVDYYGNRSIVASLAPTELFGESFACAGVQALPVSVLAAEDAAVLLLDARHVMQGCGNACGFHQQLIFNLLQIVASKNLIFHQKLEVTAQRSTREKLMTYLLLQAKACNSSSFTIPYDRQELADYLGVDRSGLSAEISRLRRERVLESRRNHFVLL